MALGPWHSAGGLCCSDRGRGSPVSSEPPAAAAVVLPDPDNSPMSHAAGRCVGHGTRTGPHCVPAVAQHLPTPTGFTRDEAFKRTGTPSPLLGPGDVGGAKSFPPRSITGEENLAGAPSRTMLSTHSGKDSGAAPGTSPHHSPTPSAGLGKRRQPQHRHSPASTRG